MLVSSNIIMIYPARPCRPKLMRLSVVSWDKLRTAVPIGSSHLLVMTWIDIASTQHHTSRVGPIEYYGNVVGPGPGFRGPAGGRSTEDRGYGGPACGGAASTATADGRDSPVHAISWATYGFSCATFTIRYSSTSTSTSRTRYSCKYEYECLSLLLIA